MNYVFLSKFLSLGILAYLGKGFLSFRKNEFYRNLLIFQIHCILLCLLNREFNILNIMIVLSIYLAYLFFTFSSSKYNYLFVLLLYLVISFTSTLMIESIIRLIFPFGNIVNETSGYQLFATLISSFTSLVACKIYIRIKEISQCFNISNILLFTFVYPLIIIVFMSFVYNDYIKITNEMLLPVMCSILIFSNIIILFVFYKSIKEIELHYRLKDSIEKERLLNVKYELLNQNYKTNFKLLHNILHYCKKLSLQNQNNEYDDLSTTIHELSDITFKEFELIHTNSLILNTLLNSKYEEIYTNKIMINTTIQYNEFSFMKLSDLTEVLSLLLNAAIESCKLNELKKRNVTIKTIKIGQQIVIQFLYPDHPDSKIDKVGLSNILDTYKGMISEEVNKELGFRSVMIILKNSSR